MNSISENTSPESHILECYGRGNLNIDMKTVALDFYSLNNKLIHTVRRTLFP